MTLPDAADLALAHLTAADENLQTGILMSHRGRVAEADERLMLALGSLRGARGVLTDAGAAPTEAATSATRREPVPLDRLDTPDVRALLTALEALLPVAERIDAHRGRSVGRVVGMTAGTDVAYRLGALVAGLRLDLFGPSDAVTGGRE